MFRVTDYFYTPKDIVRALRIKHAVGVAVGVFLMAGLKTAGVGLDVSIFITAIVTTLIWELDARVPFIGAIICFLLIMVASIISPETTSTAGTARERLAVFAFYFLVIGVVLLLREHIKPHVNEVPLQQPQKQRKNHTKVIGRLAIKYAKAPVATSHTVPTPATKTTSMHATQTHRMPHAAPVGAQAPRASHISSATTPNARTNPHLLDLRAMQPKPAHASVNMPSDAQAKPHKVVSDIRPQPLYRPTPKRTPRRIQL